MCTPHATSSESLLARKGAVEYACIVLSDPAVLVPRKIWLYMVLGLVMVLDACVWISLRWLVWRLASLVEVGGVSLKVFRI